MRPAKLYLIALFQVYIHNIFQVFCGLWSKKHKRKTGIVKKICFIQAIVTVRLRFTVPPRPQEVHS